MITATVLKHLRRHGIAWLALFVALSGSSYAAAKLAANSVTSKTVKDRSLLAKDFKLGQLPAAKPGADGRAGAAGPAGPQGPKGEAGASIAGPKGDKGDRGETGATGPAGPSASKDVVGPTAELPVGSGHTVLTTSLPAGSYLIAANVGIENTLSSPQQYNVTCDLVSPGLAGLDSSSETLVAGALTTASIGLNDVITLPSAGQVRIDCARNFFNVDPDMKVIAPRLTATRIGEVMP
jgi:hypothetical protein